MERIVTHEDADAVALELGLDPYNHNSPTTYKNHPVIQAYDSQAKERMQSYNVLALAVESMKDKLSKDGYAQLRVVLSIAATWLWAPLQYSKTDFKDRLLTIIKVFGEFDYNDFEKKKEDHVEEMDVSC